MTATQKLDEIEARANAATEGPWVGVAGDPWVHAPHLAAHDEATEIANVFDFGVDGPFIAHARQDVPALVAALRAVLALHRSEPYAPPSFPRHWGVPLAVCGICVENDIGAVEHPCPTVRAITAALDGAS